MGGDDIKKNKDIKKDSARKWLEEDLSEARSKENNIRNPIILRGSMGKHWEKDFSGFEQF